MNRRQKETKNGKDFYYYGKRCVVKKQGTKLTKKEESWLRRKKRNMNNG